MKPILTQTLAFIQKHLFPLICGVLAIVAMILTWYPASGWYASLQTALDGRKAVNDRITVIMNHQRHLPSISPDTTTPLPLTVFPRPDIIDEGTKAVGQVHEEATSLYGTFAKLNQHVLLTDGSLPSPTRNQQYQFRDDYTRYVAGNSVVQSILQGTTPPTQADINQRREDIWKSQYVAYVLKTSTGAPEPSTLAQQQQAFLAVTSTLDLVMDKERTEKYSVYIAPGFPAVDTNITAANERPDPTEIWQAQMLLWVQEDIAKAIASANSDPTSHTPLTISDAPIKQLVRVDLSPTNMYVLPPAQGPNAAGTTPPAADATAFQEPLPTNFAVSPTGRVCNGMYDVIHFNLVLDIDANRLPQVLQDMCRGQLLTIYQVTQIAPLDNNAMALQGYLYGTTPMVRVTLNLEDLYLRQWTVPLMPDKIKTMLGVPPPTPAAGS